MSFKSAKWNIRTKNGTFVTDADTLDAVESRADEVDEKPLLLLVEDKDDVASYITSCLQDNYRIDRTYNGQTGIDRALETIPDLILSDVMMPLKDGFQL